MLLVNVTQDDVGINSLFPDPKRFTLLAGTNGVFVIQSDPILMMVDRI